MHLLFTPLAEQDLESIADYIAADNPRRAITFVQELRQRCQRIALSPASYRMRPELGEGIRSCAHGHHVIFFEASASAVTMLRILHGARDLPRLFPPPEVAS